MICFLTKKGKHTLKSSSANFSIQKNFTTNLTKIPSPRWASTNSNESTPSANLGMILCTLSTLKNPSLTFLLCGTTTPNSIQHSRNKWNFLQIRGPKTSSGSSKTSTSASNKEQLCILIALKISPEMAKFSSYASNPTK